MMLRVPNYYKQFRCIADKCRNNCCSAGWEIDIDEISGRFYRSVSGEFGKKLCDNIDYSSQPHFILDENKNCPFLNNKKLCDIYINLGEEHLCQICRDHPRYYEWFDGVKEAGIGLCCEEAARIILSQEGDFSIDELDINGNKEDGYRDDDSIGDGLDCSSDSYTNYNSSLYSYLLTARQKIISYLDDNTVALNSKLSNVLWFCYTLQQDIDNDLLDDEDIFDVTSYSRSSVLPILSYFTTLEANDNSWPEYIKACIDLYIGSADKFHNFEMANPEVDVYLKNIAIYFVWRYFLKGVFDEEVLSKVKLMVISVSVLKSLFFCEWLKNGSLELEDCVEITRRYSEEIEYSEVNVQALAEASYELDVFSVERLIGLDFEEVVNGDGVV